VLSSSALHVAGLQLSSSVLSFGLLSVGNVRFFYKKKFARQVGQLGFVF